MALLCISDTPQRDTLTTTTTSSLSAMSKHLAITPRDPRELRLSDSIVQKKRAKAAAAIRASSSPSSSDSSDPDDPIPIPGTAAKIKFAPLPPRGPFICDFAAKSRRRRAAAAARVSAAKQTADKGSDGRPRRIEFASLRPRDPSLAELVARGQRLRAAARKGQPGEGRCVPKGVDEGIPAGGRGAYEGILAPESGKL